MDVHQLNCTYYSALDGDDDRYFAARAIQLFARGVPQVYYVGLLAGANDRAGLELSGDGRAINRHDYTVAEVDEALRRPVVQRLLELIRLRNSHPAFDGTLEVGSSGRGRLRLSWQAASATCALDVDLSSGRVTIEEGLPGGLAEAQVG